MDNITHSIVGIAITEWGVRLAKPAKGPSLKAFRPWLWSMAFLANNFPDLDFAYVRITAGKLGYLLHHRGHTHTLLMALPETFVICALLFLWARLRKQGFTRWEKAMLLGAALIGPVIHIGLDSLNVYGVHPFWPFDNRWYFGDSFFIVEPWTWVTLIPGLLSIPSARFVRLAMQGVFFLGLGLSWFTGFVPFEISMAMTVVGASLFAFGRWCKGARPLTAGLVLFLCVLACFLWSSAFARREFQEWFVSVPEHAEFRDVALSPFPANPFCWQVVVVSASQKEDSYRLRKGVFSPFPSVKTAAQCPAFRGLRGTLPLQPVAEVPDSRFLWEGEARLSLHSLQALAKSHCGFRAFLQFSRMPFLLRDSDQIVVGDARFDREAGMGFSEMAFPTDMKDCPRHLPPWEKPRLDLFP